MKTSSKGFTITPREEIVLEAIRNSDYGDTPWVWDVKDNSGLNHQEFGGVLSSLQHKGIITVFEYEPGEHVCYINDYGFTTC